jgi:hypothetical protein
MQNHLINHPIQQSDSIIRFKKMSDRTFNIQIMGGWYDHQNHTGSYAKKLKKFGVADLLSKANHENHASMGEIIGFDLTKKFAALYTNQGAPIATLDKPIEQHIYISSNKHNACPFVLARSNDKRLMWHIGYMDMQASLDQGRSMRHLFPRYFTEVDRQYQEYSLMSVFDDPAAEFLVTNPNLLSKEVLGVQGSIKLLQLPTGLTIQSSGLESSVRSYSVAYFFEKDDTDTLVLSGETDRTDSFWKMSQPFCNERKWEFLGKVDDVLSSL